MIVACTHTHTHTRLTALCPARVSRYQKDKTNLDFTEARDSKWQWHQLGHIQVCISLQRDIHASNPPQMYTKYCDNLKTIIIAAKLCNRDVNETRESRASILFFLILGKKFLDFRESRLATLRQQA